MACIHKTIEVGRPADEVWAAVRDVGHAHVRLFPGVLSGTVMEEGVRVVTFANDMVLRELVVSLDDGVRRLAYACVGGRARHHHASLQVLPAGPQRCSVVWITDVLPDTLAPDIAALVERGAAVMRATLERAAAGGA